MEALKNKILEYGDAIDENVLKVDSFINHQVDPILMKKVGEEFARYFRNKNITKVVTVESSGISPSIFTALELGVDLVVLKKSTSKVLSTDIVQTTITSFTKNTSFELTLSKKFIGSSDNVLFIDDFLANGQAATGAIHLIEKVGGKIVGIGIIIEKTFQPGRQILIDMGYDVYSLARIKKLGEGQIEFEN